jgi:flagellar assembly factor FliW
LSIEIETKDFGVLKIEEESVLHFPEGLFAFEDVTDYVILKKEGRPQLWLQSIKGRDPRFILFEAAGILPEYQPEIPERYLRELRIQKGEPYGLFVIAVVPQDYERTTVNLKSPVLINFSGRLGAQIILEEGDYPIRHRLFEEEKGGECPC